MKPWPMVDGLSLEILCVREREVILAGGGEAMPDDGRDMIASKLGMGMGGSEDKAAFHSGGGTGSPGATPLLVAGETADECCRETFAARWQQGRGVSGGSFRLFFQSSAPVSRLVLRGRRSQGASKSVCRQRIRGARGNGRRR